LITDSIEANVEMAQGQVEEGLDSIEANVELAQSKVEDGFSHLQSSDVDQVIDIQSPSSTWPWAISTLASILSVIKFVKYSTILVDLLRLI
jgi:hypothetical protein